MNTRIAILLLSALLAAVSVSAFASGPKTKLYKWTDEKGVVHYGSSIPPQYSKQQREVLNAQGQVVQTLAAQKTPEQVAKEQQEKAAADAKAQQAAEQVAAQRAHDQVLLDTYTSTEDMDRDRNSRLGAVDSQINVTNTSIAGLQRSLADYQSQADARSKAHKPVPDALQQKLDDTREQLATNQKLLLAQQQKKQAIRARFEADIARFKDLKAQQAAQRQPAGGG
ncbi:MAG TPA: DUF4124 domain-containing protein [Gammaproteobacteria bacterium]|nr:DUF4124 domain-containing protein [Gammaproteobacteria bacterium]